MRDERVGVGVRGAPNEGADGLRHSSGQGQEEEEEEEEKQLLQGRRWQAVRGEAGSGHVEVQKCGRSD